ncbi:hypothetical protein KEJ48_01765 [Candidatus Bathyarchaeota archaeon]|nr:hypothetical protein [Candidatus Bathyarchaeota archaeon]MBS7617774.1 hypothetical protein [Candidatus Bathyarchaeota archaeon]
MSSEKIVEEFRIKPSSMVLLIVLTIIVTFAGTVSLFLNLSVGGIFGCRYSFGPANETIMVPTFAITILLLAYPFKGRISSTTFTSLYVIGSAIGIYGIGHFQNNVNFPVSIARLTLFTEPPLRSILENMWWMPPYNVIQLIHIGGVETNWGAWANAIVFWSLYFIVFYLLTSSIMLLFRHRWIDVERLPFPYVVAAYDVVERVSGEPNVKRTMRWFILGFIVALLFEIQILCTNLFPWWPDILAWRGTATDSTSPHGCVCLYSTDIITRTLAWWPGYTKNIHPVLIYYLAPLEVLLSVWVFFVVLIILAQIAYLLGYYTGIFDAGSACRILGFAGFKMSPLFGDPYNFGWMTMIGGTVAIATMVIFNAREQLARTIRSAIYGVRSPEEAHEPFSYRQVYMFIVVSVVIVMAYLLSAGLNIGTALIVLLALGFLYPLSTTYIFGLTGCGYAFEGTVWPSWPLRFIWPQAPRDYTSEWLMSKMFMHYAQNIPSQGPGGGALYTMQCLKMGSLTKVNLRDIYMLLIITTIVSVFVGSATRVWMINLLGAGRIPLKGGCSILSWCWNEASAERYNEMPSEALLEYGIGGFVIIMALFALRTRFLWWPLHPVGFILATAISPNWMREWNAFLEAWIAKFITLRIGGSKAYEEYGVPFACGGIAGYALSNLIAYLVGTVRFFIPF